MRTKGEETKRKIVRTARRLFRQQGYGNTTIDDICREAEVKRGNLYFHFKSKQELALEAINDLTDRQIPFFRELSEDEKDPARRIELMIDGIVNYYRARGEKGNCLFGNIAQELADSDRILAEAAGRFFREWIDLLQQLFEEAKAQGILETGTDARALSHLIVSSVEGAIILYKASHNPDAYTSIGEALKSVIHCHKVPQS